MMEEGREGRVCGGWLVVGCSSESLEWGAGPILAR